MPLGHQVMQTGLALKSNAPTSCISFLDLPPEIRHQIFSLVLLHPTAQTRMYPSPSTPRTLAVLLASRLVYTDCRLLPFRLNTFTFTPWFGSSVPLCLKTLRKMAPWQRRATRSVHLKLTEADLDGCGRVGEFVRILLRQDDCGQGSQDGMAVGLGLRELRITISNSGCVVSFPSQIPLNELLEIERPWVQKNILPLMSLRRLSITVYWRGMEGADSAGNKFEKGLRTEMSWMREEDVVVRVLGFTGEKDAEWDQAPQPP